MKSVVRSFSSISNRAAPSFCRFSTLHTSQKTSSFKQKATEVFHVQFSFRSPNLRLFCTSGFQTKTPISETEESTRKDPENHITADTVQVKEDILNSQDNQGNIENVQDSLNYKDEQFVESAESKEAQNENSSDKQFAESAESKKEPEAKLPINNEQVTGTTVSREFQAQTRKILDIVARSLYTDREVFIRELISNSSDALEKLRHLQLTGEEIIQPELPLEVRIYCDENQKTIILQDTGIGMTEEELINNLGTIARSGSEEFVKQLGDTAKTADIIGQFGVGFYSTFMVATEVRVFSRSAKKGSKGYCWTSDGSGTYSIAEAEGVERGTKIFITLKPDAYEFAEKPRIETIIKKYSNFVGFDIILHDEVVNVIKALWTWPKDKITEEDHKSFYQFISHAFDDPHYKLHYAIDTPLSLTSLFYVPSKHVEKYGMGKMDPGVSIFSKKVLIQSKARGILPDWLRFIKGVVDSPEIPLNISREHLQDSLLIKRLNTLLSKKILKFLNEEMKLDPKKYDKFFTEFGSFLKEGICTDMQWKVELSKLLRMESSHTQKGQYTTFDEYLTRMKPDQTEIFYLCTPARNFAEESPYYESYQEKGIEVLFFYTSLDDFVMSNIGTFQTKKLVSIEVSKKDDVAKDYSAEQQKIVDWFTKILSARVHKVQLTNRLVNSPAIIVDHESASIRRMMKFVDPERAPSLPKQTFEVNPKHPIIIKTMQIKDSNSKIASEVAHQLLDNALIAAGLLDDARQLLPRLNILLEAAVTNSVNSQSPLDSTQEQVQEPKQVSE